MEITVKAEGNVKSISRKDMSELESILEKLKVKYDIKVQIRNFHIDCNV